MGMFRRDLSNSLRPSKPFVYFNYFEQIVEKSFNFSALRRLLSNGVGFKEYLNLMNRNKKTLIHIVLRIILQSL